MNAQLIFFVELLLALLVIGGILAAGASDAGRTLRVLAGAAAGLLLAAVFLLAVTDYRPFAADGGLARSGDDQRLMLFAVLQLFVLGLGLALGAWALAASRIARARQWGWFVGLLLAALLIPVAGAALYSPQMLLGASAANAIGPSGTVVGLPYVVVVGLLMLVAPLAILAYSMTPAGLAISGAPADIPAAVSPAHSPAARPTRRAPADEGLRVAAAKELRFQHSIWPILTLAALQLLLGYQWLVSGLDKVLLGTFPETMNTLLQQTLTGGRLPSFFVDLMRTFVLPNSAIFGVLVEVGETLAGVALIGSAIVELMRPAADLRDGWLAAVLAQLERLLDILAPVAAAGTLLLGINYYLLDGAPTLLPTPSIAYGGAINSGLLLALGSVVLLLGHYAHRKAIARTRDLEQQVRLEDLEGLEAGAADEASVREPEPVEAVR